jgi:hypothetical protein
VKRITTKAELVELAGELEVRPDWHEPDEVGVTASTHGRTFDNAGFWGSDNTCHTQEMYVIVCKDRKAVAEVNLATLFAWATGLED